MVTSPEEIERFERLFDIAALLPEQEQPERTVLQILGVDTREIRISRLLQFYLDPNQFHGLDDLLIRSLLTASGCEDLAQDVVIESVEREVPTERGNRIDLLVNADGFLCCIENKVLAPLSNNLDEYRRYTESQAGDRQSICVLLSLEDLQNLEVEDWIPVTYASLFHNVESRLGVHATRAQPIYLILLFDLIRSIGRLGETDMETEWDDKFVDFLKDERRRNQARDLLQRIDALKAEMRRRVESLDERVRSMGPAGWETELERLKPGYYRKVNPFEFFDSVVYHDIEVGEGCGIDLGIRITLDGWRFRVRALGSNTLPDVSKALSRREIRVEGYTSETKRLLINCDDGLSFQASIEDVASSTHELLTRLLGTVEAPDQSSSAG